MHMPRGLRALPAGCAQRMLVPTAQQKYSLYEIHMPVLSDALNSPLGQKVLLSPFFPMRKLRLR